MDHRAPAGASSSALAQGLGQYYEVASPDADEVPVPLNLLNAASHSAVYLEIHLAIGGN
jgi:hypothetical protein